MRRRFLICALATLLGTAVFGAFAVATPLASAQEIDSQVPPGNPVIGDERPADIADTGDSNYLLWSVVAVCLIGAGLLLVRIERWEARRIEHQVPS